MSHKIHIDISDLRSRISELSNGDQILLTGVVFTARDAAHKRLVSMIEKGEKLPIELKDSVIYYTGPTPTPPGMVIGACGPTSSHRMDPYLPSLLEKGLLGMIGKGERSKEAMDFIKRFGAVYFSAIGGAGALACKYIKSMKEVAFLDLGCESIKELYIENFPVVYMK